MDSLCLHDLFRWQDDNECSNPPGKPSMPAVLELPTIVLIAVSRNRTCLSRCHSLALQSASGLRAGEFRDVFGKPRRKCTRSNGMTLLSTHRTQLNSHTLTAPDPIRRGGGSRSRHEPFAEHTVICHAEEQVLTLKQRISGRRSPWVIFHLLPSLVTQRCFSRGLLLQS